MKERPILFSAPMVRALLAGTKTQTRRVLKQAVGPSLSVNMADDAPGAAELSRLHGDGPGHEVHETIKRISCPYGQPGGRLWVRESFRLLDSFDSDSPAAVGEKCLNAGYPKPWAPTQYEADGARNNWMNVGTLPGIPEPGKLRPGIHMPRWASRLTLEITGVRVERLQAISEADAKAEGCPCYVCGAPMDGKSEADCHCFHATAKPSDYRALWERINGAGSWDANPWVWCVSFKRAAD